MRTKKKDRTDRDADEDSRSTNDTVQIPSPKSNYT